MFSSSSSDSSLIKINSKTYEKENIDCNISNSNDLHRYNETIIHRWTENETKYLLDQYCMYFSQIGPFRAFKNKNVMFDQIEKDLFTKFNIKVTAQQCINRYKNVVRQNKYALSSNKVSGNTSTEVPYKDEFEDIKSIDDSLMPEVLLGVNHIKMNEKMKVEIGKTKRRLNTNGTEEKENEKSRKRLKSDSLELTLRDIYATAEENRERRHKEKCELLISLLGKSSKE